MKKRILLCILIILSIIFSTVCTFASTMPTISIENTTAVVGEEIRVPVSLANNTGICGATLSVEYDEHLTLNGIERGDAVPSLAFTKPGNMTANPFNLVFDGLEEDNKDGIIVYLLFDAITEIGTYNISISYADGDILNGTPAPIDVKMVNGQVTVTAKTDNNDSGDNSGDSGDNNNGNDNYDGTIISVGEVKANANGSVDVPLYVSQNTGICGATLIITYNEALTLTNITKSEALAGLTMTKPGVITANPFNLVFDGVEADTTNGVFAILTFDTPAEDGVYDIEVSYPEGEIFDGTPAPINVLTQNGSITIGSNDIKITIGDKTVNMPATDEINGTIYVAFYTTDGKMTSVKTYPINTKTITTDADTSANYAKVFCWTDNLVPLCDAQSVTLK